MVLGALGYTEKNGKQPASKKPKIKSEVLDN